MSAIGLGSTAGTLALPWLSDFIGRKPVMVLSTVGAPLSLLLLATSGAEMKPLFGFLFMVHFFNNALITLTVGPLCSETVPAPLMATASGLVIAVGELFGGGCAGHRGSGCTANRHRADPVVADHHDGRRVPPQPFYAGNAVERQDTAIESVQQRA